MYVYAQKHTCVSIGIHMCTHIYIYIYVHTLCLSFPEGAYEGDRGLGPRIWILGCWCAAGWVDRGIQFQEDRLVLRFCL